MDQFVKFEEYRDQFAKFKTIIKINLRFTLYKLRNKLHCKIKFLGGK